MKAGDRVKPSALGNKRHPSLRGTRAIVVSVVRGGRRLRLQREGQRTVQTWDRTFWQLDRHQMLLDECMAALLAEAVKAQDERTEPEEPA